MSIVTPSWEHQRVREFQLPSEIILTFEEARVIYLALVQALDGAEQGRELHIRLDACSAILARKFLPGLGDLP